MRRVVVTGLGLVTPLACGVEQSWSRLLDGKSGAGTITRFDASNLATTYACEVPIGDGSDGSFNPEEWMDKKERRKVDDFILYGMSAAIQAIEDSGWKPDADEDRWKTGVLIGSGIGGLPEISSGAITVHEGRARAADGAGACDASGGAATLDPPCDCAEGFAGAHCEVCAEGFAGAHCEADCSTASGTHAHCSTAGTCDANVLSTAEKAKLMLHQGYAMPDGTQDEEERANLENSFAQPTDADLMNRSEGQQPEKVRIQESERHFGRLNSRACRTVGKSGSRSGEVSNQPIFSGRVAVRKRYDLR